MVFAAPTASLRVTLAGRTWSQQHESPLSRVEYREPAEKGPFRYEDRLYRPRVDPR